MAGPFPGFIEPMLATLASTAFDDPGWLFEIKWDGYRVEAVVRGGQVSLHTRNGKDAGTYFPGLLSPPDWISADEAVVDGEVVALDPEGMPRLRPAPGAAGGQVRLGNGAPDEVPRRPAKGPRPAPRPHSSTRRSTCSTSTACRSSGCPSRNASACCGRSFATAPTSAMRPTSRAPGSPSWPRRPSETWRASWPRSAARRTSPGGGSPAG